MADYAALDRTRWDFSQPPVLVSAVSATANADASAATVQIDFLVDATSASANADANPATVLADLLVSAVSASANADASAATVLGGTTALLVSAVSASAQYQASPCGVIEQGAEITTLWAYPVVRTILAAAQTQVTTFSRAPRVISVFASAQNRTDLSAVPNCKTLLAGISPVTILHSTPAVI